MHQTFRLVVDTNTVMALWHFEDPALAVLRQAIERGEFALFCREDALEEYRRVLAYRQFDIDPDRQQRLLADYRARVTLVDAASDEAAALPLCRDRDDQKFLEIARDANATHLLTRDKLLLKVGRHRLLRDRYLVQTPERFVSEQRCPTD